MKPNEYVFEIPIRLVACVLVCLASPPSQADDLDTIRDIVQESFRRIETMHVVTRLRNPNFVSSSDVVPSYDYEWVVSNDGRSRRAFTQVIDPSKVEGDSPQIDIAVYNGIEGRTVTRDVVDFKQTTGSILTDEGVYESLIKFPPSSGEFGRAMGWLLNGRSLPEWLDDTEAELVGAEEIMGEACSVILVNDKFKFYLAQNKNFAMKRYETLTPSGEAKFTIDIYDFAEIEPGIWFPMRGNIDAHGRPRPDGIRTKPYSFEVQKLEINQPLEAELFELEFDDGLYVVDYRFNIIMNWNVGIIEILGSELDLLTGIYAELPLLEGTPETSSPDSQIVPTPSLLPEKSAPETDRQRMVGLFVVIISVMLIILKLRSKLGRKTHS